MRLQRDLSLRIVGAQGMLVFDVELLEILRLPPVPGDVGAPPADAAVTSSGLASKVLAPGSGTVAALAHPTSTGANPWI